MSSKKYDAHRITDQDDVAVVVRPVLAGELIRVKGEPEDLQLQAVQDIPPAHKIALRSLSKGEQVLKYGQCIGDASQDIPVGGHVHVHNLEGRRGRGDIV